MKTEKKRGLSMSGSKTKIQKEILDEVLKFYGKRREEEAERDIREEDAGIRLSPREAQQDSSGRYEPGGDFYKVLSKLVGKYDPDQMVIHRSPEKKAIPITQDLDKKADLSQKLERTEKHEEKTGQTSSATRFLDDEMLSHRGKEDEKKSFLGFLERRPDLSQEPQRGITKISQPSVFERLTRAHVEEDFKETEHVNQNLSKKPDYSKEMEKVEKKEEVLDKTTSYIQPSIFQRIALAREEELKHSKQDLNKVPDVSQELEKNERQEEKMVETGELDKPAIFQKLFRRIKRIFVRARKKLMIFANKNLRATKNPYFMHGLGT